MPRLYKDASLFKIMGGTVRAGGNFGPLFIENEGKTYEVQIANWDKDPTIKVFQAKERLDL